VNPNDIVRCDMIMRMASGGEAHNVFHAQWQGPGVLTPSEVGTDWIEYLESIYEIFEPFITPPLVFEPSRVSIVIPPVPDLDLVTIVTPDINVSSGAPEIPDQTAVLLSVQLDGSGRGTAKKFIPQVNEGFTDGSLLVPAAQATVNAATAFWIIPFGVTLGANWLPATWTVGRGLRFFEFANSRTVLATIGRRKPGVGI